MTTLIIPMAGKGKRFEEQGYIFPKPLIEVNKRLMVEYVLDNFERLDDLNYVFLILKEHEDKFEMSKVLTRLIPEAKIVIIPEVTEGAAQTVLYADTEVDDNEDVIVCNCDQWLEWNEMEFLKKAKENNGHMIVTFNSVHPKFSYVKYNGEKVTEVKEKSPISDIATTGIYYWKTWEDFKWGANVMIEKNKRTKGEFYVCPVYQEHIERGDIIKIYPATMHSLGTPEDLQEFDKYLKKQELEI